MELNEIILRKLIRNGDKGMCFLPRQTKIYPAIKAHRQPHPYNQSIYLKNIATIPRLDRSFEDITDYLPHQVEKALNSLRSQCLLFWSYALTIGKIAEESNSDKEITLLKATVEQDKLILKTERKFLKAFGCRSRREVYEKGMSNEFHKKVANALFEEDGIVIYYNSYQINYTLEDVLDAFENIQYISKKIGS